MEMAEALAVIGKALGAGLCMGIGAIGPALGEPYFIFSDSRSSKNEG